MVDKPFWDTGEEAPVGTYACTQCPSENQQIAMVLSEKGKLPECPTCGVTVWYKV